MSSTNPPNSSHSTENSEISSKYPTKIIETDICTTWFVHDTEPHESTPIYFIHFQSPLASGLIENVSMNFILKEAITDLTEGLWYQTSTGLELQSYRKTSSIDSIVKDLVDGIALLADKYTTEAHFKQIIKWYTRGVASLSEDIDKWSQILRDYITPNHETTFFEILPCLSTLCLDDFRRYCRDYFKQIKIEALVQGNIDKEKAIDTMNRLVNGVKWNKIDDLSSIAQKSVHLPIGSHYLRCTIQMPRCYKSIVHNFYVLGSDSIYSSVMRDLFVKCLGITIESMMDGACENDAGIVMNCLKNYADEQFLIGYDINGEFFESEITAEFVDRYIDQIRCDLIQTIERMSEETFAQRKKSIDDKLDDFGAFYRNWRQIKYQSYEFDTNEDVEQCLSQITKADFLAFAREHCDQQKHRKLSVQLIRDRNVACDAGDPCAFGCTSTDHNLFPKPIGLINSTPERFLADLKNFKNDLNIQST